MSPLIINFVLLLSKGRDTACWLQFDKYVPKSVASLAQKYIGSKLVYVDILAYDPNKLQRSPYQIGVKSIPPVFQNSVRAQFRKCSPLPSNT